MSRVLCRRGLARGAESCAFTIDDLIEALQPDNTGCVYVEPDGAGQLSARGGAARAAAAARLAPSAPARTAELALAPRGSRPAPALLLRAAAPLPPHHEPLLWFADELLLALGMPFLTPRNVRARRHYVCHECGAGFLEPNPLKLHLFLRCGPFDAPRFWREAGARLRAAPAPPAAPGPAELEALAAEWGRSRDGHACLYCGKLYSRRYGLKIHLRTHTGYRPLRCRYCLRAFGDPSNLNKHVRLHAARAVGPAAGGPAPGGQSAGGPAPGGPPYACGVCGRALARRRDLERHMRAHGPSPSPSPK